jgi:hypothetical protein
MGSGDGVTVHGADEVQRTLQDLADTLEDLDAPGRAAGGLIVKAAQGYARRKSGRMRASIEAEVLAGHGVRVSAGGGIPGPYPAVQEYGSRRHGITPNAYMARAADTQERAVVGEYDSAVTAAADNVRGV